VGKEGVYHVKERLIDLWIIPPLANWEHQCQERYPHGQWLGVSIWFRQMYCIVSVNGELLVQSAMVQQPLVRGQIYCSKTYGTTVRNVSALLSVHSLASLGFPYDPILMQSVSLAW